MNSNDFLCICSKVFKVKEFESHIKLCKTFQNQFQKLEYLIKEYIRKFDYLLITLFLEQYTKFLKDYINKVIISNNIHNNKIIESKGNKINFLDFQKIGSEELNFGPNNFNINFVDINLDKITFRKIIHTFKEVYIKGNYSKIISSERYCQKLKEKTGLDWFILVEFNCYSKNNEIDYFFTSTISENIIIFSFDFNKYILKFLDD